MNPLGTHFETHEGRYAEWEFTKGKCSLINLTVLYNKLMEYMDKSRTVKLDHIKYILTFAHCDITDCVGGN